MNKSKIVKFSADASTGLMSFVLDDGRSFSGWESVRDVRASYKTIFDEKLFWIKVEDEVWFEENFTENKRRAKLIARGQLDF